MSIKESTILYLQAGISFFCAFVGVGILFNPDPNLHLAVLSLCVSGETGRRAYRKLRALPKGGPQAFPEMSQFPVQENPPKQRN